MPIWVAILIAVFVWWFTTGVILYVIRHADRTGGDAYKMAVLFSVPVVALGVAGVILSVADPSLTGVYLGFFGALLVWGWIELTFLSGVITGPDRAPCPPGLRGHQRFWRAWRALAHHELLLLLGLIGIAGISLWGDNSTALWTYTILFFARISAKLNLFFGVPRINVEFIPKPLEHLKTHFRQGPITLAFPLAIMGLSLAIGFFAERLISAGNPAEAVSAALLTALAALALLEHWLMVVPLPDAKLWRWMLPASPRPTED